MQSDPKASDLGSAPVFERIIEVARRRFEQFGYRRTAIGEIARDAGVAAGTLYRHFKNKEDIFLQVLDADNAAWLARAEEALSQPGTAPERLAALARASTEYNQESQLLRAVRRGDAEIVFAPLLEELRERLLKRNVSLIAQVIQDGIEEGSIRPVDPELIAYILYVMGETFFNESHHPYEELNAAFGDLVFNGMVPK